MGLKYGNVKEGWTNGYACCAEAMFQDEGLEWNELMLRSGSINDAFLKKRHQYLFGEVLGQGNFGKVLVARNRLTGENVAVKTIRKNADRKADQDRVLQEINMLQNMHHKHIVAFKDWFESDSEYYIVTQLATGGELLERVCQRKRFSEPDAVLLIKQVLSAVSYLHARGIVHRDLKPENILYLDHKPDSPIVLADFGIAEKLTHTDELIYSTAGTPGYTAPEVYRSSSSRRGYTKQCDIWSLGIITYVLLSGRFPFPTESREAFLKDVASEKPLFQNVYFKNISNMAKHFIGSMLNVNPSRRPSVEELQRHPWINTSDWKNPNRVAQNRHEAHFVDLLPQVKSGFDAVGKMRQAVDMVKVTNQMKRMRSLENVSGMLEEKHVLYPCAREDYGFGVRETRLKTMQSVVLAAVSNRERILEYQASSQHFPSH